MIVIINIIALISSVAYLYRYSKVDLSDTILAVIQVSAYGCAIYSIIVGYIQRQEIRDLFPEYQKIRNKCKIMIWVIVGTVSLISI